MGRSLSAWKHGLVLVTLAVLGGGCGSSSPNNSTATGGAGDAGGASGASGASGSGGAPAYPAHLSETGLYSDIASGTISSGVEPYTPNYALWADGSGKNRWIYLPPGSKIDTSDLTTMSGMDYWRYPSGTTVWKQFSLDGKRLETRMLKKNGSRWTMIAYQWRADQSDADALPNGAQDVAGTDHDIPSQKQCATCHQAMPDTLLGVTAIQLDHAGPGLTLSTLVSRGQLTVPPAGSFALPGDATAQAALGYLHANCGLCHNPYSPVYQRVKLAFWLENDHLATVQDTSTYRTAVGKPSANGGLIIAPGDSANSRVIQRMQSSDPLERMPPLGTEHVDTDGVAAVSAWIDSLQ